MFPDSAVAQKYTNSRTKQIYILNFAIAPYITNKISETIRGNDFPYYSIAFDEADGSMMLMARHIQKGRVVNDMIGLPYLDGDYSSKNCTDAIVSTIDSANLPRRSCISDFSDSCNAMRGKYCFVYILIPKHCAFILS